MLKPKKKSLIVENQKFGRNSYRGKKMSFVFRVNIRAIYSFNVYNASEQI